MALFNYRVGEPVDSIPGVSRVPHYPVLRYGLHGDLKIAVFATSFQAEQAKHALINETGEMALIARNEAIHDIRQLFLGDKRLKIDLSALPHIAQATKPQDVALTIALAEMTETLNELSVLRRVIAESVGLSDLLRMGYGVDEGNALLAKCRTNIVEKEGE